MAKYLVVEDERFAFEEIKRMMSRLRPGFELAGWAQSIEQALLLLKQPDIDFVLLDIRLTDGLSFEIFDRAPIDIPVIFTTAYDEYALKAFKVNSVDYLLKPIEDEDLEHALAKFERNAVIRSTSESMMRLRREFQEGFIKERFLIQAGDTFRYVKVEDIAYFLSEDKCTFLWLFSGKRFIIDYSLDQLEGMLDPRHFFRVSRHCIAGIKSVKRSSRYFGGRHKLYLEPENGQDMMVSRSRVPDFLKWMDGIVD